MILNQKKTTHYMIFEPYSLTQGKTYIFNTNVKHIDLISNNYEFGTVNVEIYINQAPSIVDGSFNIFPNCNNISNTNSIDLIDFVTNYQFSLNIEANGGNLTLFY